ncbi:uncharacterized protein LOC112269423 isoform X2 [Brachypodium distachyon]|uniref:Uncharacterized protein n=1 Tax=Brachypodium distachyon TaxID=15368 RepID=A0A0Q3E3C4_BRADI|nr:uncharacterized protein LOC112269423 isoform X2 [Brachypodium distachyon]KQJ82142.1 hypothetical protein BRADI_5g06632v3 [Brachypodium distachyon]|eukprot:XP_024311917.1 uncharacterized protein LOC112269423 isoform X2 [Brachypodium distachyon]
MLLQAYCAPRPVHRPLRTGRGNPSRCTGSLVALTVPAAGDGTAVSKAVATPSPSATTTTMKKRDAVVAVMAARTSPGTVAGCPGARAAATSHIAARTPAGGTLPMMIWHWARTALGLVLYAGATTARSELQRLLLQKKVLVVQDTNTAAEGSVELAQGSEVQVADGSCTLQEFLDNIAQPRPRHLLPTPAKSATSKRQLQQNIANDPAQQNMQENSIVRRSARLSKNPKGAGALELKAQEFLARGLGIISDGEDFDDAAKSLFVKMFQGPEPLTEAAILAIDKLVVLIKKKMQKKKGKGKGKAKETLLLGAAPVVDV